VAYVEVKAKTVELAVEAAMRELGVDSRDRLEIEVIQEPERGFLGFGGQDAIVKVTEKEPRPKRSRNRKRRGKGKGPNGEGGNAPAGSGKARTSQSAKGGRGDNGGNQRSSERPAKDESAKPGGNQKPKDDDRADLDTAGQEPLVAEFLRGLLTAFGLEGSVESRVEDDVIIANVVGEQTEALVGPRGSVMEAVHELTKTVLQRATQSPARVRIDIAGYAERRRQALTIYAGDLIRQVKEEGGELMLEPMSASDRKVIHDAVAAVEGVRSYSEGEAPNRYVVIAAEESGEDEAPEEGPAEEPQPVESSSEDLGDDTESQPQESSEFEEISSEEE
jgi:spoIIIJ-associated protein